MGCANTKEVSKPNKRQEKYVDNNPKDAVPSSSAQEKPKGPTKIIQKAPKA